MSKEKGGVLSYTHTQQQRNNHSNQCNSNNNANNHSNQLNLNNTRYQGSKAVNR